MEVWNYEPHSLQWSSCVSIFRIYDPPPEIVEKEKGMKEEKNLLRCISLFFMKLTLCASYRSYLILNIFFELDSVVLLFSPPLSSLPLIFHPLIPY